MSKTKNIRHFIKLTLIIFLLFLLLYNNPISAADYDNQIIGGARIGPVTLGQPVALYTSYLGKQIHVSLNFIDCPSRSMLLQIQDGRITGIMIYSSDYKTREGIKIGDPVSNMVSQYGRYLQTDSGSLVYNELGLAFNIRDGRISRIMIVQATPDFLLGDKLLIPGIRAGNIKIGDNANKIMEAWGQPDSVDKSESNPDVRILKYKRKALNIIVTGEIIRGMTINSYKFRTPDGIGIDSTLKQVTDIYGSNFKKVEDSIMYESRGIGFYIHNNKVIEILILDRR
jgi:hypothetical protein